MSDPTPAAASTSATPDAKRPIETRLFINGEFVHATSGQTISLRNAATDELVAEVEVAGKEDVDRAVAAAKAAQPAWAALSGKDRGKFLRKLSEEIEKHADELADLEVASVGKPKMWALMENQWARDYIDTAVGLGEAVYGESSLNEPGHLNLVLRQPYGVVAGVIAWNLGVPFWVWKVAPAIVAGNTIVLKASEKSPLQSILLGKLTALAGFPPGVVNIVNGAGITGQALAEHPQIRKISFTGSTQTGRRVQQAALSSNLKAVTLELGGKSPSIIFNDADVKNAVEAVALSLAINMGQVCTANTRVYVQEDLYPVFLEHLKGAFETWTKGQGDPTNMSSVLGTLADSAQQRAVTEFIKIGKEEAKVAIGGEHNGGFVKPTIFTDVSDDSRINREEIFGPILVYHTFKTEEEVIQRANDTEYGLYASVFTKDIDRAIRVAKQLESGSVGINTASPTLYYDVPLGGWKSSGYGKELGHNWVLGWTQEKTIHLKIASA